MLGKVSLNGLSELMTNISLSVVTIFYNMQLMKLVGIAGVSAYGVIQYIGFIFVAVFLGYSIGSAPIVGYHYGAQSTDELKNIFKKSLLIMVALGVGMALVACVFAKAFASIFVHYDPALLQMTTKGLRIYSLSFVTCGLNIFASAFFTALGNGGISLLISFARTFFCQIVCVLVLPVLFGLNGVWCAVVVAECVTLVLTVLLFIWQRKRYQYA